MLNLSGCNPTDRFTGLAEVYARCRPSYPEEALDFIVKHCGLVAGGGLLVDVGSGTGISSRLFAARGHRVAGIEPNADMRERARREPLPPDVPQPEYCDGLAESTGLPDGCARVVLAAQAFHWFDAPAALAEFHRILQPGGWVVLLWNERDETDPFTAAVGEAFRAVPGAAALESARGAAGEPLLTCSLFEAGERIVFVYTQVLDLEGLLGRAFSASYAPREPLAARAFATALEQAFVRYQQQGRVVLHYQTSVWLGRRARSHADTTEQGEQLTVRVSRSTLGAESASSAP